MKYIVNTTEDPLEIVWDSAPHVLPADEAMVVEDHIADRFTSLFGEAVSVHAMSELVAVEEGSPEKGYRLRTAEDEKPKAKPRKKRQVFKRKTNRAAPKRKK